MYGKFDTKSRSEHLKVAFNNFPCFFFFALSCKQTLLKFIHVIFGDISFDFLTVKFFASVEF